MEEFSPELLALPQRLALSYARATERGAWLALFAFDCRLAQFVSKMNEPLLAQMRLAWWRDALRKPLSERPQGDPVLAALGREFEGDETALIALVDGWEALLADPPLARHAAIEFALGRTAPVIALAGPDSSPATIDSMYRVTRRWSLVDLGLGCTDARDRELCFDLARKEGLDAIRLPRSMRPLQVLDTLAMRSLGKRLRSLLGDRGAALLAMRVGMFGR